MQMEIPSLPATLALGSLGCVVFYVLRFYYRVSQYPRGPTPLPLLGNILDFRGNKFIHDVLTDLSYKYGPTFTIFLGPVPIIVISDQQVGIEAMRKAAYAGRPDYGLIEVMFREGSTDVFFGDFSREWEVLRRIAHDAIRKYIKSERHSRFVAWAVDQMMEDVSNGKDFDTTTYFTLMMNAILASAAFGQQYNFDDPDFLAWKSAIEKQGAGNGKIMLIMFIPWLKYVYSGYWKQYQESNDFQYEFIEKRFVKAQETFNEDNITNFCEAIISARNDAEKEESESSKYMTHQNLMNTVRDLFFAGSDTTKSTLRWIWLLMCKYPEMQEKVRQEILKAFEGEEDKIPTAEDREKCPYTNAFIYESMRYRTISPTGIPHKTTCDTELAGYKLKKGTIVLLPYYKALMDRETWTDPEVFRPERFISPEGKFVAKPNSFFLSFGVGRRSCPGNQMASLTMFLVISRMIQKTKGKKFYIKGGIDSVSLSGSKRGGMWMAEKYSLEIL